MDILSRIALRGSNGIVLTRVPLTRVPRISVVIPCYNYGRFLKQCVDSVLNDQPGVDVEIVIVDDKSTDDSREIALAIGAKHPQVRLISHETNQGHIKTYNDGLEAATGEFVMLLSADDLVTPGALTRAAELLTTDEAIGLVYGNAIHFHGQLPQSRLRGKDWIVWAGEDWVRVRCKSGYNVVASPEVMMRTSTLREIGGYRPDLPHAADFEMWLRTAAVAKIGYLVGVDQAFYRHHSANMNKTQFTDGTARGQLVDLKQRWQSFEAVFTGLGKRLEQADNLFRTARRTMARQALERPIYAYARGFRDFPVAAFEEAARAIDADVETTRTWRALARRKRLGMVSLPLHPLWAMSAVMWRMAGMVHGWRRYRIGI